jgi:RHS repeat-associated protein
VKGWLYADQLRPIAELDGSGDVTARFVYGTKPNVPEYIIKGSITYRDFSDHLGSPREIVDASTGVVVQRMDFQAFGEIIQDSNPGWQPFGFAGSLHDSDTALNRSGARDYDAETGKWLAQDPVSFLGGGANLYSYVSSNAVNAIDPSGLLEWSDYAHIAAEGLKGAGQGLAASVDGAIPFFDPLEGLGLYDPDCFGLGFSKTVGGWSLQTLAGFAALRGLSAASQTEWGEFLNHNRYLRIGPGKMTGYKGQKTPRISIGNGQPSPWNHIPLTVFGK